MAWTDITRAEHKRIYSRYPSDCSDEEWAIIEPFLPPVRHGGRPRTTDMRSLMDAILYMAQGGIQWRMLPKDFPPLSTVQRYFYDWRKSGVLSGINFALVQR